MSSDYSEDLQTIIVDVGACTTKVGYAVDQAGIEHPQPHAIIPTLIGTPINPEVPFFGCKEYFVGHEAMKMRGSLKLSRPIQRGVINDMEAMEQILQCSLMNELRANASHSSILMTDKLFSPRKQRERLCELIFERFEVQGYFVALQGILPMYDSKIDTETALVIDIGHDITEVTPIHEGFILMHQAKRTSISGRTIDLKMSQLLAESCNYTNTPTPAPYRLFPDTLNDLELVREVKESVCQVVLDCETRRRDYEEDTVVETYTLPDGRELLVDEECFRAPEVLFDPSLLGSTAPGLSELIYEVVMGCPIDTRRDLFGNIVLVGGTSNLKGLPERIENDLEKMVPKSVKMGIGIVEKPETVAWAGAACLSGSIQFRHGQLTRAQYDENGAGIIHSKFYFDKQLFPHYKQYTDYTDYYTD